MQDDQNPSNGTVADKSYDIGELATSSLMGKKHKNWYFDHVVSRWCIFMWNCESCISFFFYLFFSQTPRSTLHHNHPSTIRVHLYVWLPAPFMLEPPPHFSPYLMSLSVICTASLALHEAHRFKLMCWAPLNFSMWKLLLGWQCNYEEHENLMNKSDKYIQAHSRDAGTCSDSDRFNTIRKGLKGSLVFTQTKSLIT